MKLNKIEYIDRRTNKISIENVPGEGFLKFLYHNAFGKLPLELLVKRKCLSSFYGKLMDTKISINRIEAFVRNNHIDMSETEKKMEDFTSFNDFFYRKLKPDARKIEDGVVSPADGKAIGFEKINDWDKFFVKGTEFSLKKYLNNKELCEKYRGGNMIIVRLAPADYHRYHFPANGKIGSRNKIDGYYYSVSPYAIKDNFGVFCENKRELTTLETIEYGDILISEVGATMVGGIEQTYTPDTDVKKGEEKGYFTFGGSSVLLLFEKGKVRIDNDILKNTKNGYETKVSVGETIGE